MSMRIPTIEIRGASAKVDTVLVAVAQDKGGKPTGDLGPFTETVEKLAKAGVFKAAVKSVQFIRFAGQEHAENVLFAGMGKLESLEAEQVRQAGGAVGSRLKAEKVSALGIDVAAFKSGMRGLKRITWKDALEALLEGIELSLYPIHGYKSEKGEAEPLPKVVLFAGADKAAVTEIVERVRAVTEAVYLARDWSNEPANTGVPAHFAAEAKRLGAKAGLKMKVLGLRELKAEKMGLLLGVAQGSVHEPRVVIAEYRPKRMTKKTKTVCLVGKGVTFDSGGISIKPAGSMEEMKHDMSGAADVMAAILLCAKLEVPNRVVALMGFVENMPSGNAMNPSSVVTSRSGKTVEIINTDAEGRLVLADVIDYAHQFKPDVMIDLATLTGAIGYAIGKQCCGLFTNDADLSDTLRRLGEQMGERMADMPMYDEYAEYLKSEYADLKNSVPSTLGGAVTAAMFLKQFVKKGVRWAHLDIAYTAWDLGHVSYHPKKGATGAYVRTLARFAQQFA